MFESLRNNPKLPLKSFMVGAVQKNPKESENHDWALIWMPPVFRLCCYCPEAKPNSSISSMDESQCEYHDEDLSRCTLSVATCALWNSFLMNIQMVQALLAFWKARKTWLLPQVIGPGHDLTNYFWLHAQEKQVGIPSHYCDIIHY